MAHRKKQSETVTTPVDEFDAFAVRELASSIRQRTGIARPSLGVLPKWLNERIAKWFDGRPNNPASDLKRFKRLIEVLQIKPVMDGWGTVYHEDGGSSFVSEPFYGDELKLAQAKLFADELKLDLKNGSSSYRCPPLTTRYRWTPRGTP